MRKCFNAVFCFLLTVFLLASQNALNAQTDRGTETRVDYNYSKFKSEFEKEFGLEEISDLNDSPSNIKQVFFKSELPEWVLNFPESSESIIYGIGVSEPGMSKDSAYQLATLRAKATLSLLKNASISGLSDYYIIEKDLDNNDIIASSYREFYEIISHLTFNSSDFNIVKDTFTVNNEAIVLASLSIGSSLTSDSVAITSYSEVSNSHKKRNNKYSSTARMELTAGEQEPNNKDNNYFQYVVKKINKKTKVASNFSGQTIPSNTDVMYYKPNTKTSDKESLNFSCTLQNGLWHAFTMVLLETLVVNYHDSDIRQSSLRDEYSELSQNINRIYSQKHINVRIKGLLIQNNTLQIESELIVQE